MPTKTPRCRSVHRRSYDQEARSMQRPRCDRMVTEDRTDGQRSAGVVHHMCEEMSGPAVADDNGGGIHHTRTYTHHPSPLSASLSNDPCGGVAMMGWTYIHVMVGNGWAAPQHLTEQCVMRSAAFVFGGGNAILSMRQWCRYVGPGNQRQQILSRSVPLRSQPVACSAWRRVGTDGGFSTMHGDQINDICMPQRRERNPVGSGGGGGLWPLTVMMIRR